MPDSCRLSKRFCSGSLGFPGAEQLHRALQKIRQYRDEGEVIFTFDTHGDNYAETRGENLPIAHCIRGTSGHDLYGEVAELVCESDAKFYKNTFGSDELYVYLKKHPFSQIVLVGLVSNFCVLSNAVLAKTAQPETPVIVDAACTASNDPKLNEALDVLAGMHMKVIGENNLSCLINSISPLTLPVICGIIINA